MTRSKLLKTVLFGAALGLVAPALAAPAQVTGVAKRAPRAKTGIQWKITPGAVVVHLDGKALGKAQKLGFTKTKPGVHTIRLVKDGDESEMDVTVPKGQVLQFTFDFSE